MELIFFGTGNALVSEFYNTCFAFRDGKDCFLVDAGGGNAILGRLKKAGIAPGDIRDIFVTHKHIDHLLGVIWLIRTIAPQMENGKISGRLNIYAHDEVIALIEELCEKLLQRKQSKHLGKNILLHTVSDGDTISVLGRRVEFFDIHSTKAKQFGFAMELGGGERLCCCGDEPLNAANEAYARGSAWLLHEAFCLDGEADIFKPYEKSHSTVKTACETAERMGVKNLVLYHTEESHAGQRKALYTAEGREYFGGALHVPDDMESFQI